jgi:hypothetical protein
MFRNVPRRLLTVEDTFAIKGRGLVLAPDLATAEVLRGAVELDVKRPDGTTQRISGHVSVAFFSPSGSAVVLHLPTATKQEVPIGSQLWTID